MMQSAEELDGTSEYMKSFFASKVYLERNDQKLFKKISDYLTQVKKPRNNTNIYRTHNLEEQETEELI